MDKGEGENPGGSSGATTTATPTTSTDKGEGENPGGSSNSDIPSPLSGLGPGTSMAVGVAIGMAGCVILRIAYWCQKRPDKASRASPSVTAVAHAGPPTFGITVPAGALAPLELRYDGPLSRSRDMGSS